MLKLHGYAHQSRTLSARDLRRREGVCDAQAPRRRVDRVGR
jgi:hypothetical protein